VAVAEEEVEEETSSSKSRKHSAYTVIHVKDPSKTSDSIFQKT
jgi:hypothetical protein